MNRTWISLKTMTINYWIWNQRIMNPILRKWKSIKLWLSQKKLIIEEPCEEYLPICTFVLGKEEYMTCETCECHSQVWGPLLKLPRYHWHFSFKTTPHVDFVLFWCSILQLFFPICTIKSSITLIKNWKSTCKAKTMHMKQYIMLWRRLRGSGQLNCGQEKTCKGPCVCYSRQGTLILIPKDYFTLSYLKCERNNDILLYIIQVWATSNTYRILPLGTLN